MKHLTTQALRRPWWTVVAWVVLAAVAAPLAFSLSSHLKAGGFEDPQGDSANAAAIAQRAFGEPANTLQVVLTDSGADPGSLAQATEAVLDAAQDMPQVTVLSSDAAPTGATTISPNTTLVVLGLDVDNTSTQNLVPSIRSDLDTALTEAGTETVSAHVTGAAALDYDLNVQSKEDATRAELIAFPLLFLVLLVLFRSVAAMLVPLVLAGMTLVITQGIGRLLTSATDLSILFTNGVSLIGLAVAVDYSLFIIKRYREELDEGLAPPEALALAMSTAGHAVVFSGLAVVVALATLLIPGLMVFTSIALAGVVVTAVALLMSATLLPAVLSILGRQIDWGRVPGRSRRARANVHPERRPMGRLASVGVLVGLVAGFVALAWPVHDVRLQVPVASASILPADADSRQGVEALQARGAAASLFPVQVVLSGEDAGQVAQAAAQVEDAAGALTSVTSVEVDRRGAVDPVTGRTVARVALTTDLGPDSEAAHRLVAEVRALPVPSGVTAEVGGATAGGTDFDTVVVDSLPAILLAVAVATLALLGWAFRSWQLPLMALALNGLVVSGALGLLTLLSTHLAGEEINSVTPILLFAIMFGLSMDYLVIMISRMREFYVAGASHTAAVQRGLRSTAGLVNGAALIMVAVFASFMSAEISIVRQLGLGLAIAVVLDAVVVRLFLMPAVLRVLGPSVWGSVARRGRVEGRVPGAAGAGPHVPPAPESTQSTLIGAR